MIIRFTYFENKFNGERYCDHDGKFVELKRQERGCRNMPRSGRIDAQCKEETPAIDFVRKTNNGTGSNQQRKQFGKKEAWKINLKR